jgi:Fe-S-cluster containining protein
MSSADVFALSIHADYRCRHSGACCSADWDVPIELPVYRTLQEAVSTGRLRPQASARHLPPFVVEPDLPEGAAAMLERTEIGECVFLERDTRLCIVHRDLGEPSLPATCRYFPRLAVRDDRGTFITLSHFCPTAASMLFRDDCPLEIVSGPHAFPPGEYEGLIVTGNDLPPLLSPTMLMDPGGYSAWERHMVARCAEIDWSPEVVVGTLHRDAQLLRTWKPGGATLAGAVRDLPPNPEPAASPQTLDSSLLQYAHVMQAVPDDLRPQPDEHGLEKAFADDVRPAWSSFQIPVNRYLAAKAFASWTAYQGRGVATIVRGLDAALSVVRLEAARQCRNAGRRLDADLLREAFRSADFILNHLAVGEDLADAWSQAES